MKYFIFICFLCVLTFSDVLAWRRQSILPKGFTLSNNHFGLKIFEELSKYNSAKPVRENIFFSPHSISMTLSMLHQGVNGSAGDELNEVLGYDLAKLKLKDDVSKEVKENLDRIKEASENGSFVLTNGNAIMIDNKFAVFDSYKTAMNDYFDCEVFDIDFSKPVEAQELLNEWISNKTNQKITNLVDSPPNPDTKMALLNAIYFKGSWKLKFNSNRTETGVFTDSMNNKYENVSFMNTKAYFNVGYLSEIEANLIELPYEGDDLSMYAILPDDKQSDMEHIKKALNPWYIEAAIGRTYNNEVKIKFPKLKFQLKYDLIPVLQKMGINQVFSGKADFGLISNQTKLAVGVVKHAATIDINEEGSEASAATYITIVKLSLNLNTPTYEFDHPFIFFIRNNKNGNILFIGEVNKF